MRDLVMPLWLFVLCLGVGLAGVAILVASAFARRPRIADTIADLRPGLTLDAYAALGVFDGHGGVEIITGWNDATALGDLAHAMAAAADDLSDRAAAETMGGVTA